jgi:HK97 family phage prohead protease
MTDLVQVEAVDEVVVTAETIVSPRRASVPRPMTSGERIERKTTGKVELRVVEGTPPTIYGHGATFDVLTRIDDWFGSYMEKVARGAFTKTLADGADVRCLWNHDPNYVLGRTKSGTLTLSEDSTGLAYEATPPDTQWARDLGITMARGDVDGSSFGFRIIRDKWSMVLDPEGDGKNDMLDCRTLLECQLFDVSPVTFPAYVESDSAIRSALQGAGFDFEVLGRVLFRRDHGLTLSTHDQAQFRALLDHLRRYLLPKARLL